LNDEEVYECLKGIEIGGADGGLMTNKEALAHIVDFRLRRCVLGYSHCCRYIRLCMVTFVAHELQLTVTTKRKKRRAVDDDDDAGHPDSAVPQCFSVYIS